MILFDHTDPLQWLAYAIIMRNTYGRDTTDLWYTLAWELDDDREAAKLYVQAFGKWLDERRRAARGRFSRPARPDKSSGI